MEKTTHNVTMAYLRAGQQINDLETIARELEHLKKKLEEQRTSLHGYWSGENADMYCAKMYKREQELSSLIYDIKNIASTVQSVAKNTYKADMRAIQLAKERKKGGGGRAW